MSASRFLATLHVDIETRSRAELKKTGVYRYVEDPDFAIILISYALDSGPVKVVDLLTEDHGLDQFVEYLLDPRVKKVAFNAQFERVCLAMHFGRPMPPEEWECAMVRAYELGLPGTLGEVGDRIGLKEDKKKWADGLKLIRTFCIPDKKTGEFRDPHALPDAWARFKGYCVRDTEAERAICDRLAAFPLPESEHRLWCIDQRANERGVMIDQNVAMAAIEAAKAEIDRLEKEACDITGLDNPRSRQQLLNWLRAAQTEEGLEESEDLKKKTVARLLHSAPPIEIETVLRLRQEISKSSISKYNAMLRGVCADGRLRGLLQFYGAIRTGRWAGRQVQVQNLPQNQIEDLREMRQILITDASAIGLFYDSVLSVLSELIRTAFVPAPGKRLISVDFSAIEARVIAWIAAEEWRLDVFRTHGKIYEASAEQMFGLPPGSIKKGDPMRQKGKIAELALGFQGGVGALETMGALDMGLTKEELPEIKDRWRVASPRIVCLWYAMEEAARTAVLYRGQRVKVFPIMQRIAEERGLDLSDDAGARYVSFVRQSGILFMHLPSGRRLAYPHPRVEEGKFGPKVTFMGLHPVTHKWARIDTFGGRLTENLVQATARDCLKEAMFRAEEELEAELTFSVHDELVLEADEAQAEQVLADALGIMAEPLSWAPGLPLKAEGDVLDFYRKA